MDGDGILIDICEPQKTFSISLHFTIDFLGLLAKKSNGCLLKMRYASMIKTISMLEYLVLYNGALYDHDIYHHIVFRFSHFRERGRGTRFI